MTENQPKTDISIPSAEQDDALHSGHDPLHSGHDPLPWLIRSLRQKKQQAVAEKSRQNLLGNEQQPNEPVKKER